MSDPKNCFHTLYFSIKSSTMLSRGVNCRRIVGDTYGCMHGTYLPFRSKIARAISHSSHIYLLFFNIITIFVLQAFPVVRLILQFFMMFFFIILCRSTLICNQASCTDWIPVSLLLSGSSNIIASPIYAYLVGTYTKT